MNTLNRITELLHSSNLSWLLSNLRQDFVVWNSLNDPTFYEKFIQSKPAESVYSPADFSPSRLALLALGQPDCAEIVPQNLFDLVEPQILQSALRSFSDQVILKTYPQDLASAGMISIASAHKYHSTGSWNELISTLACTDDQIWSAPMACLFGYIENPTSLLTALVQPGCEPSRVKLAVHTVLSNPIPPEEQVALLLGICTGQYGDLLPPSDRITLVSELNEQRPHLATAFCSQWLETHPEFSPEVNQNHRKTIRDIDQLTEILFQIRLRELTGNSDVPADLISLEGSLSHNLYTNLAGRVLSHSAKGLAGNSSVTDLSITGEKAIHISGFSLPCNYNSPRQAELALIHSQQGFIDEAFNLLPPPTEPLPDNVDILYAIARIEFESGNLQRSEAAASRLMELLDQGASIGDVPVWGEYFSQVNLGKLLLDIHKPTEAARVLEFALRVCPNDFTLLKLVAESYKSSRQDQLACDAFHALVSLNPSEIDYRRAFAASLEDLSEWEACLNERSVIIGSNQTSSKSQQTADCYAYAQCALKADHPELALKVCLDLLADDQDDSQALIYTGQAHLQMNEIDRGLEFLVRATEASHQLPEAWLALANAQKRIYPLSTVIETLKNGAQAIPDCPQIYFALGELYLQDNAPTLALPNLRCAVELSPTDPAILVSYGQALKLLGHFDEAREALSKAYALEPGFPGLAHMYSRILLDSGDLEGAISPLELLINTKSVHDPAIYLDYARCVLTLHKRGSTASSPMKALIALNEVMIIDPELAEAKALTAEALAASGENELAFEAYREALDTCLIEDKDWRERLAYGFGCIASAVGKYDIALAALQDASQANPNNPAIFKALSDAYLSADLPEDALRSARSVLVIDGDNPDSLAWFAQHMVKIMRTQPQDGSNSSTGLSKQVPTEALTALNKAIQLAPTRTDLLIQLGNLLSLLGAKEEARVTYASIAAFDFATIADLQGAAEYLGRIGDHASAIACLEKGISMDQAASHQHIPSLYTNLAQEYVKNHDHTSAINILDQAIELIPADSSLLSLKVDILLGLGQCFDALHCIETALQKSSDHTLNNDLLFLASRINRSMGDFNAAIDFARIAATTTHKPGTKMNLTDLNISQLTHITELYRALLQPHQAYQILQEAAHPIPVDLAAEPEYLDYICLYTELALETGEQIRPEIEDVSVESSNQNFSWLMAIRSRLMNLAGNFKQAEQLYQIAAHNLDKTADPAGPTSWEAPYIKYRNAVAVIEAALDLGMWDQAEDLIHQVLESRPGEPLPYLNFAKSIIRKGEFNKLCEVFEVINHKPALNSLASESINQCTHYLDQAQSFLEAHQGEQIIADHAVTNDQIYRWRTRADIIFEHDAEISPDEYEILTHFRSGEDSAALIDYLHHLSVLEPDSDSMSRIIKLARSAPHNPAVILQVALALYETNPADALKALQSVLQHNPFSRNPTIAFCNILLARIGIKLEDYTSSREAVEAALEFWPDEPFWHSLAARVYLRTSEISNAAGHLSAASQLDPTNIAYHLDLGKLYLDSAQDDSRTLHQALECFEKAVALDQKEISALVSLATTQCLIHDLENANDNARKALLLAPNRADIYQLLSEIAIRSEDYQGAYEYANKAILANPKDIQSTVTLVNALSALGRHQEALARLDSAITVDPQSKQLYLERVNILRKKDGARVALAELTGLTRLYPDDFIIFNTLSKLYIEVGEPENALSAAQQALKSCTEKTSRNEQASLHLMIGQILRQCGQLDQSIQHLSEAIQLAPDRLEPYLELGLARKERREYQQALQIFERATVIAPNDPRAPYQAGLALKESKDYKSSETMLRRAVSLAPNDLTIRRQLAAVVALNLVHNPRTGRK
jgi:tetratricopeptide (TPR) repeat protein